jgi:hypothetical protein
MDWLAINPPGWRAERRMLRGHLDGLVLEGPAEEHEDAGRCLNAKDLKDPWHDYCKNYMVAHLGMTKTHCASCIADSTETLEHRYLPASTNGFRCYRCCRMRGHFLAGYRRHHYCACRHCQHHPIPLTPHSYDLQWEMVGYTG